NCTPKTFAENAPLILYGAVIVVIAVLASYPISCLFIRKAGANAEKYQRNIYKYAMTFGNYGFMGNFIILGIWGDEMFFKYMMFCLIPGIICNSWGLYALIPKDKNQGAWANIKKGLTAPPMICLAIGIIIGLLNARKYMPDFLLSVFSGAGQCQGPVAMVLAGFVIGGYNLKKIIANNKAYFATFLRLIVIPAVLMVALHFMGVSKELMTIALIFIATPIGLNTIVFPAAYGGDTETGAAMVTISHTLSVITIPAMYLLFITLL
ncbi:MAG: AEC family transporter, partial [Clostridia bacterium]|nr:AEC family transporter [Clostridia bacterium]